MKQSIIAHFLFTMALFANAGIKAQTLDSKISLSSNNLSATECPGIQVLENKAKIYCSRAAFAPSVDWNALMGTLDVDQVPAKVRLIYRNAQQLGVLIDQDAVLSSQKVYTIRGGRGNQVMGYAFVDEFTNSQSGFHAQFVSKFNNEQDSAWVALSYSLR
jgi:hypothetical protein